MVRKQNCNVNPSPVDIAGSNIDGLISDIQKSKKIIANGVLESSKKIAECILSGGKILICGNGGSAAHAQHIAAEFVVRLSSQRQRKACAAIALSTDSSIITAAGNDLGFDEIFSRQIEAYGKKADILLAISTSGNSPNVYKAVQKAKGAGLTTIGLLGGAGGKLKKAVHIPITVSSISTGRIQEIHINIAHSIVESVEEILKKGWKVK